MQASRRLAIRAAFFCAALSAGAPIMAFDDWLAPIILWSALANSWLLLERGRLKHPPDWITRNAIAVPVAVVVYFDFFVLRTPLMAAASRTFCLLLAAKAIKRKTTADLWTMFFLSQLQILVGALVCLDALYFLVWIASSILSVFFLNAMLALPAREGATVAVHLPPGTTFFRRLARLSSSLWMLLVGAWAAVFLFFPRDLTALRETLSMRGNSERLSWSAGLMVTERGAANRSGFTGDVDVSSLADVLLDPAEALEVRLSRFDRPFWPTPDTLYLRGRALERFDGRRWMVGEDDLGEVPGRNWSDLWNRRASSGDPVRIEVKPLAERGNTLFLPRPVVEVGLPVVMADLVGNLQRTQMLDRPYSATCLWRPWEGQAASPRTWWTHDLLDLPSSPYTEEYERLAQEITREATTTEERAEAVSRWLAENCRYTLHLEWRSNSDPVHEFLRRRHGYCLHFATTMAVLLRSVGIPCRLAVGYAGGTISRERGAFILRKSDAHAWVEVPYRNGVWRPYDPTAGARLARAGAETASLGWWGRWRTLMDQNVLFFDAPQQRDFAVALAGLMRLAVTPAGWAILVIVAAGIFWLAHRSARKRSRVEQILRAREPIPIPSWPTIDFYRETLRLLRSAGVERTASTTPRELLADVACRRAEIAAPVFVLTEMFESERYGGRAADGAAAQAALAQLRSALAGR